MGIFKKILKKLAKPDWLVAVFAVALFAAAACGMSLTLIYCPETNLWYFFNLLLVVLLGYIIYMIVLLCKYLKLRVVAWAQNYTFAKKFVDSYDFRTIIFALGKFIINIGYAVFSAIYGIIFRSPWYIVLSVYHFVLCISRGIMVARSRRTNRRQYTDCERETERIKIYRAAGILLLVFTVALDGVLFEMKTNADVGYKYAGAQIFVIAGFTFYKVAMAVYNLVKARGSEDYVTRAVRNINFAEALVSVLTLQSAMIAEFSENGFSEWGDIALGTLICLATAFMGVYMIVHAQRKLKTKTVPEEAGDDGVE